PVLVVVHLVSHVRFCRDELLMGVRRLAMGIMVMVNGVVMRMRIRVMRRVLGRLGRSLLFDGLAHDQDGLMAGGVGVGGAGACLGGTCLGTFGACGRSFMRGFDVLASLVDGCLVAGGGLRLSLRGRNAVLADRLAAPPVTPAVGAAPASAPGAPVHFVLGLAMRALLFGDRPLAVGGRGLGVGGIGFREHPGTVAVAPG